MASEKVITRKIVRLPGAVASGIPYSPAVIVDNTMYLSGALGVDPSTNTIVPGGIGPQTEQALTNIGGLLKVAGIDFNNVVKVTVLLDDINDWPAMNKIYEKFFKSHYPARAAYSVKNLPMGAKVEIEAVAVVGKIVDQD
jgi:2-iminobutanoate/2-iminopropanoate deaminase